MNKVDHLLKNPFSQLKAEEKLEIKNLGAYQPRDINITQKDGNKNRKFCVSWFDETPWLTFSDEKNSLFCFYCILFEGENLWTHTGCKDLKHISERIQKHESSKIHITNTVKFKMFGKVYISSAIDAEYRLGIAKHNESAVKNRHSLSRIIDCIKFCGFHELPLTGHDESIRSHNRGVFLDMVSYTANLDSALSDHLENSKICQNTSKTIQNDLLDCMYQIYVEELKNEIDKVNFVSVQADETSDIACRSQFVIILRYMKNSQPVERFLTFVDVHDRTPFGLTNVLKQELLPFNLNSKLIAQAYNGAEFRNGVQIQMKEFYPFAHYVHCYAHQLNLILKKVCSTNISIKIFFSTLNGIGVFFTSSPKRNNLFEEVCSAQIPKASKTRWNFRSKIINCVKEKKRELLKCFRKILSEEDWDDKSVWEAVGLKRALEDFEFNFFLSFFYSVFKHVDVLYNVLQSNTNTNNKTAENALKKFEKTINQLKNTIKKSTPNVVKTVDNNETLLTRRKRLRNDKKRDTLEIHATKACHQIIGEITDRFQNFKVFHSFSLVDPKQFSSNKDNFPTTLIDSIKNNYPMINTDKLTSELTVIYENEIFANISKINALSTFLIDNKMLDIFSEVSKLVEIALVTPVSIADAERCFNTLKRIKTVLRNSIEEERLNALAVLFIHKEYISEINNFNQRVIEKFAHMNDIREEYLYK